MHVFAEFVKVHESPTKVREETQPPKGSKQAVGRCLDIALTSDVELVCASRGESIGLLGPIICKFQVISNTLPINSGVRVVHVPPSVHTACYGHTKWELKSSNTAVEWLTAGCLTWVVMSPRLT